MADRILTLNGGSSSIKFSVYELDETSHCALTGAVERIGLPDAQVRWIQAGQFEQSAPLTAASHRAAIEQLLPILARQIDLQTVVAVGHRIVHGGPRWTESTVITDDVLNDLRTIVAWDPLHLPSELALVEAATQVLPQALQIACFDTAFHAHLPLTAQMLPLPRRYFEQGIRRYGFHGLSYAYLLSRLQFEAGEHAAMGRVVLAHLGSGASLAAVREGRCLDTSMAFSPNSGLVMGTRTGDIDPGVLTYLMHSEQLSVDALDDLVNRQSGLKGLSGVSSDIRDLAERSPTDPHAAQALDIFCYELKKWIGAFTAVLGGLDTLVFSGGIGEHSPLVRAAACQGLEYLGMSLDQDANLRNASVISTRTSNVTVRVIPTNEEATLLNEVQKLWAGRSVVDSP